MPATLTGPLLTSYREAVKYDQVVTLSATDLLPEGYQILSSFLVEDFLVTVGLGTEKVRIGIRNLNDQTQTETRILETDVAPVVFPLEDGVVLLGQPNTVSTLKVSNGIWGDLNTGSLDRNLPSKYTVQPLLRDGYIWVANRTDLWTINVSTLVVKDVDLNKGGAITALEADQTSVYVTREKTAVIERYNRQLLLTDTSPQAPSSTFRFKADKKPTYLNTVNRLYRIEGNLLIGSYDGTVLSWDLTKGAATSIGSLMTDCQYLSATAQYASMVSADGDIRLYDFTRQEEISLDLSGLDPVVLAEPSLTGQFFVVPDKAGAVVLYKLDEVPDLKLHYVMLEAKDKTTKFLDLNVELSNPTPNVVDQAPYEVSLYYRGAKAVKTLQETGQRRNFYVPLSMHDQILSEVSLYLGTEPITYTIKNLATGVNVTSKTQTLYSGKLEKFFLKDFYVSENDIYFKLMYLSTTKSSLVFTINGKKILYTAEEGNWYNPTDYVSIYKKEEFPDLPSKFYLLKGTNVGQLTGEEVSVKVELLVKGVVKESVTAVRPLITKLAYADLKYSTSDGDIRYQDELLLTELEQGDKTTFLKDNSLTPTITPISKMDIRLTDDSKLGNIISGEGETGYLTFPIRNDYADHLYKSDSLLMDIYINGHKLPRSNSQQQYTLEGGALRVDYPVRDLQAVLTSDQLEKLFDKSVSDAASGISIMATVRRKPLVSSELLLGSYVVSDTYQNDIERLQGSGIYIPFTTKRANLSQAELRLFIRNSDEGLIRRFNPTNYTLKLDLPNKQIKIELLGTTKLAIGSELIIVDSGYLTNTIKYVNNNSAYRMDSLPLVSFDSKNAMYNGLPYKAEDLDISVSGLTLVPERDYTVIEPTLSNTPTMITFRNYLPVGTTVEVNYLPENSQKVFYWTTPAKGTSNRFSLDDERYLFVKGTFETFVNNLKIDETKVKIKNNRTIEIQVPNPRNVMVRFSTRPHSNLKLIQDSYKFATIDVTDNNYHSAFSPSSPSLYDQMSLGVSTDIGKIALLEMLNTDSALIFDCNQKDATITDIYLDSKYIDNQYINRDLIVDANRVNHAQESLPPVPANPLI